MTISVSASPKSSRRPLLRKSESAARDAATAPVESDRSFAARSVGPCRAAVLLLIVVCLLIRAGSSVAAADHDTTGDGDILSRTINPHSGAAGTSRKAAPRSARPLGSPAGWGTTAGALVLVVGVILIAAQILRRRGPAAHTHLPQEVLQVLGRRLLDYRHTVHLVRCGARLLIVGSSQTGLTTLAEITDPAEVDYLAGLCRAAEPASVGESFQQLFRRFRADEPAPEPEAQATSSGEDPAVLRWREHLEPGMPAGETSPELRHRQETA